MEFFTSFKIINRPKVSGYSIHTFPFKPNSAPFMFQYRLYKYLYNGLSSYCTF